MNLLQKIDSDMSNIGEVSYETIEMARHMLNQNLHLAPSIGAEFGGGRYAGIIRNTESNFSYLESNLSYHLVYADSFYECFDVSWYAAVTLASESMNSAFTGWALPTRLEMMILAINAPDSFDLDEKYWTSSESSTTADCAWTQTFSEGKQICISKKAKCRARAVRRIPIYTNLAGTL